MKIDQLVSKYVELRDKLAEEKAAYDQRVDKIKEVMGKIEDKLLAHFEETGSESVRTEAGTAYRSIKSTASVADRDTWFNWVLDNPDERLLFVEARCSKKAIEEYAEANGELPPGINYSQVAVCNVRRSS